MALLQGASTGAGLTGALVGIGVLQTVIYLLFIRAVDLYERDVNPVEVRRRIGMVFQKPNPVPKSIYDNIAFGPRVLGRKKRMDEIVEKALTRAEGTRSFMRFRQRMSVDLPQPDGPMNAVTWLR